VAEELRLGETWYPICEVRHLFFCCLLQHTSIIGNGPSLGGATICFLITTLLRHTTGRLVLVLFTFVLLSDNFSSYGVPEGKRTIFDARFERLELLRRVPEKAEMYVVSV
jgi:hypothetical protein